ncbi:diaminopimelate epimerase, partial [Bacteroidota bacterium]
INTGVPHYVCFRKNINDIDVYSEGKKIRYSDKFTKEGINVNFVNIGKNALLLRTYERGVEDETLACGTGIVASAIIASIHTKSTNNKYTVLVKGGILEVSFSKKTEDQFENIWLRGPANMVYKGEY